MRVIYRKNTSCELSIHQKECRKSLGCALSIEKYVSCIFLVINCNFLYALQSIRLEAACYVIQIYSCISHLIKEEVSIFKNSPTCCCCLYYRDSRRETQQSLYLWRLFSFTFFLEVWKNRLKIIPKENGTKGKNVSGADFSNNGIRTESQLKLHKVMSAPTLLDESKSLDVDEEKIRKKTMLLSNTVKSLHEFALLSRFIVSDNGTAFACICGRENFSKIGVNCLKPRIKNGNN